MVVPWLDEVVVWLRSYGSHVLVFLAGLITTKIFELAYDRLKTVLTERRDRKKLKEILYRELADNYSRLDDAIREYDDSKKDEHAPTVDGIRISTERYVAARKDLMKFDELGRAGRAIEVVYSSFSGFKGKGNLAEHWVIVKTTKKSIEDELRRKVLDADLLIRQIDNEQRRKNLRAIL